MLMGATLPAIARWKSRGHDAASVGCSTWPTWPAAQPAPVLAGFYLLRVYDTFVATCVAVTSERRRRARVLEHARSAPDAPSRHLENLDRRPAAAARFVYAAAALVRIHRARRRGGVDAPALAALRRQRLHVLVDSCRVPHGLGLGGFGGSLLARRSKNPQSTLAAVQVLLAVAIAMGAWTIVNVLPGWQPTSQFLPQVHATPSLAFAFDALRCAYALLPATLLWGASFPLTLAAAAVISVDTWRASTPPTLRGRSPGRSRSR
jgi:spermidine synthase